MSEQFTGRLVAPPIQYCNLLQYRNSPVVSVAGAKIPAKIGAIMPENDTLSRLSNSQRIHNLLSARQFRVGSWNLQGGLRSADYFDQVIKDLIDRRVQVACLQETHCQGEVVNREVGKVICLEDSCDTPTAQRYGLGFFIGADLIHSYHDHRYISNRIAVLRLKSPYKDNIKKGPRRQATNFICIINVYAPTSQFALRHPEEYEGFYETLNKVVEDYRKTSSFLIVAGDCNSKLGMRECTDSGDNESFMGPFGKGTRNRNGGYFASFLDTQHLFAVNTQFKHAMRHRTTWNGDITNSSGKLIKVRNQIDYIMVSQCYKKAVQQARSYHGHTFSSDHAIIAATLRLDVVYSMPRGSTRKLGRGKPECEAEGCWPRGQSTQNKKVRNLGQQVDLRALADSNELQQVYSKTLQENIDTCTQPTNTSIIQHIQHIITTAAKKCIPEKQKSDLGRIRYYKDTALQKLSAQQKALRLQIQNLPSTRLQSSGKALKRSRSKIFKQIQQRTRVLREETTTRLAEELENTPYIQRVFEIHNVFRKKEYKPFELGDDDGTSTFSTEKMVSMVTEFYTNFFNPPGSQQVAVWGDYDGPLTHPLDAMEVLAATQKLRNGRAAGIDGIPGELLKYGGLSLATHIAEAVNNMFITKEFIDALGQGILIPLNKPGKPKRVGNLRPITLLTTMRKAISLVALERIYKQVEKYLPKSQCGFRRKRSTTEIAWAYSWIKATARKYQRPIHVIGIDMSRAFDCMDRNKVLYILEHDIFIEESDLRIIRALLGQTSLTVKINGAYGNPFPTILGTPQGDGLSPILFTIYLEGAMRELRLSDGALYGRFNGVNWRDDIWEMSYADDVDFVSPDKQLLETLIEIIPSKFETNFGLKVNKDKTERKTFSQNHTDQVDFKKLGTKVDPAADVRYRIQKSNAAFFSMWKTWQCHKVSVPLRVRLYNACIKSILLYNIAAQAYTELMIRKLEAAHRKQLKHILRIYWPNIISSKEIYRRTGTVTIRADIIIARWNFFQRSLLIHPLTPAPLAMKQYFKESQPAPRIKGKQPSYLPTILHKELKLVGIKLSTYEEYIKVRLLARNDKQWKLLCKQIINKALTIAEEAADDRRAKRKAAEERKNRETNDTDGRTPKRRRLLATGETQGPGQNPSPQGNAQQTPNSGIDTQGINALGSTRTHSNKRRGESATETDPENASTRKRQRGEPATAWAGVERTMRNIYSSIVYNTTGLCRDS